MDAFASPSTHTEHPLIGRFRVVEMVVTTLAIGLSLFNPLNPADPNLDASWQMMLIHAHAAGLQFGRDIIFTWGPWGFLCSLYSVGRLEAVPILIWQVAGQLAIAVALVTLTRDLAAWRRAAFLLALLAFHWLFQDTVYFVLIALIAIAALMRPGAGIAHLVAWTLLLGFLAQVKFTYFVISAAAVFAAMGCWAGRGSLRRVWSLAAGYVIGVLGAWAAAGQDLGNLYTYLRRSIEIASGYADAMGFDESLPLFTSGACIAIACVAFCWEVARTAPDRPMALASAGYLAFSLFVMWKESFIRADFVTLGGHVFGFFAYVMILGPAAVGLLFPGRRWHWFDLSLPLCLAAVAWFDPAYYTEAPRIAWQRYYGNVFSLGRLNSLPGEWQASYEGVAKSVSLPRIRAAVGTGTADVYNYSIGIALLNGLNIFSRPIFQSYSAYTPSLEGKNLRFYQSRLAPDFLLWRDENVDGRYPGQDDAMLVAALPGHYEAMFREGEYWLFRRVTPLSAIPAPRKLAFERTVRLSEEIEVPAKGGFAVWIEADPVPNALGRLRGLLYKPALINLSTADKKGNRQLWRLVPRVARAGFILVPTLADGSDLASLMNGTARSTIRSFHFEAPQGQGKFWDCINVKVYQLPGLPIHGQDPE
jgi:hypothetical protein